MRPLLPYFLALAIGGCRCQPFGPGGPNIEALDPMPTTDQCAKMCEGGKVKAHRGCECR